MTLTDRQQACDLWCIDHPDLPASPVFDADEVAESRARIASKRKAAAYYAAATPSASEKAELLSDVDKLTARCIAAEGYARAADTLLSERMDMEHKEVATTAWLIIGAYAAGILTLAGIAHWCGWRL